VSPSRGARRPFGARQTHAYALAHDDSGTEGPSSHDHPETRSCQPAAVHRWIVALRLLRSRKIFLISIAGVALGLASIVVAMSLMDGYRLAIERMLRGRSLDLEVELDPGRDHDPAAVRRAARAVAGVTEATFRIQGFGVLSGAREGELLPVRLLAVDDAGFDRRDLVEPAGGDPLGPVGPGGDRGGLRIVLSRRLADRVGAAPARVGDRIRIVTFRPRPAEGDARESYTTREFDAVLAGVYATGYDEFDRFHAYLPLDEARATIFADDPFRIVTVGVAVAEPRRAEAWRLPLARALEGLDPMAAAFPEASVETWQTREAVLLRGLDNDKFLLGWILFFIVLVGCFTLFATLSMAVQEKRRDIGVLRALGETPVGVAATFLLAGGTVGVLGAASGMALGALTALGVNPLRDALRAWAGIDLFPPDIYHFERIPVHVDLAVVAPFAVAAVLAALLFAAVPALRAARLMPVDALRYE